ncbi:MAG: InlB B-repeat-containing protein [Candidatus Moraniibacteriota bacterium]
MGEVFFKKSSVLLAAVVLAIGSFSMFAGTASATSLNLPVIASGGQNIYIYPTANNSLNAPWGCQGTTIGSGAQSGTDGYGNTAAILAACNATGTAADICADLNEGAGYNGYTDWYLPALDQLAAIDTEIAANRLYKGDYTETWAPFLSGFSDAYWSSTEYWWSTYPADNATYHMFSNNSWFYQAKNFGYRVRCVRSDSNTTYAVTYDGNGETDGSVPTDFYPYENAFTVTVKGNTGSLAKTGYVFKGWNTAANGSGTTYASANTFTMGSANVTLYAKWVQTYAVSYFVFGGHGTLGATVGGDSITTGESVEQGSEVVFTASPAEGYQVKRWAFAGSYVPGNTTNTYTISDLEAANTVSVEFEEIPPATYTVTFDSQGGSSVSPITGIASGGTVTLPTAPTKDGYTFASWNTAADGNGSAFDASTAITGNLTVYAQWTDSHSDNSSDANETTKAKIDSWSTSLFTDQSSCPQKLKLTIKGKHFNDNAKVRINGTNADSVDVKYSRKLVAIFCMDKLLKVKTGHKRNIYVTNPDTDSEKADRKIDLDDLISKNEEDLNSAVSNDYYNQKTKEGARHIQQALNKLGYLEAENITGTYGELTMEAVKKFQADNGIEATGFVGELTKAKLAEKVR